MNIKQLLCPIIGTWYLFGGYEYGHRWRHNEYSDYIYCKDCGKKISFLIYKNSTPFTSDNE